MKKILIVNDAFPPHAGGGANMIAFFHAKGLLERGYEVHVFTTTQDIKVPVGWSEYQGLKICTFYTNYDLRFWGYVGLYNRQVVTEFKKELAKIKPDIVHFHNIHNYFSYHTLWLAKRSGARVFMTMHDVMSFTYQKLDTFIDRTDTRIPGHNNYRVSWLQNLRIAKKRFNPVRNFVVRRYLAQADKLLAVSGALRDALEQNGMRSVEVVRNGVAAEMFERPVDTESLRRELGLDNAPLVLFMGRITPPKGSEVLFKAISIVKHSLPNVKLLAVGTTIDEGIKTILRRLDISSSVAVLPAVPYEGVYKYYGIADVVVAPSIIFDSFPTVNLDAMAAGKPVVATCFGGSREAVEDNVTGYIVNPLNIENLAQKILFLLQHPQEAKAMGERGRSRVKSNFTLRQMLDDYCAYYK